MSFHPHIITVITHTMIIKTSTWQTILGHTWAPPLPCPWLFPWQWFCIKSPTIRISFAIQHRFSTLLQSMWGAGWQQSKWKRSWLAESWNIFFTFEFSQKIVRQHQQCPIGIGHSSSPQNKSGSDKVDDYHGGHENKAERLKLQHPWSNIDYTGTARCFPLPKIGFIPCIMIIHDQLIFSIYL